MDSMRSLNTSLPSAPPEQLLQAFRTAALSVTNLYKAATDQSASRQAGYQDALEDLLSFLDNENIGLQDGEGWRIRQWATERYNNDRIAPGPHNGNEDRHDNAQDDCQNNQSTTLDHASRSPEPTETEVKIDVPTTSPPSSEAQSTTSETNENADAKPPMFQFVGNEGVLNLDQMVDIENQAPSPSADQVQPSPQLSGRYAAPQHHSRKSISHTVPKPSTRTTTRDLTFTTGSKRKLHFPDFFDISDATTGGFNGQGAGKKGRFS